MKYLVWQFYKTKKGSICIHEKCTKFMSFWYKGALVDYVCKLIFKNYTPREHCFEILCQWIQGNLWCNFCWIAYQYLIDFYWQKVDKMMENLKELNSNTMVFNIFFSHLNEISTQGRQMAYSLPKWGKDKNLILLGLLRR